ncbi:MAG: AAA family ATPase, partial [Reinekea sp.]|nr:AAA family ATPase [Reinekea sp.]
MARIAQVTDQLVKQASRVVAGKSEQIRLIWVSLLCGGHVLLEDLPGVGKTTLAQSLGNLLGLKYQRVQFTADLLPSDIIGAQIFDRDRQEFKFHRGPVFTQLLLADELNRATPKAQSALL